MKTERFDFHRHITNQIIAAIETSAGEFRLPWKRSAGNIMRPPRRIKGRLSWRQHPHALGRGRFFPLLLRHWGTYAQWAEVGAQVRKGEKAAYVVFSKEIIVANEDSDEAEPHLFASACRFSPPSSSKATKRQWSKLSRGPKLTLPRPAQS
jgi:antirestriction protein ArdC